MKQCLEQMNQCINTNQDDIEGLLSIVNKDALEEYKEADLE
jgi:hypothetical protein